MILSIIDIEEAKRNYVEATNDAPEKATLQELVEYSDLSNAEKERIASFDNEVFKWKILDIHDANERNGFYACTIETEEADAMIAFRGSEKDDMVYDWVLGNIGLLNSMSTLQHIEAQKYADELITKGILDKYNEVDLVGHSLGGNLASHFAISCSNPERQSLFEKIGQCYNMDGPGFSQAYLKEHSQEINMAESKITHYKWSAIGSLLNDLPNEKKEVLTVEDRGLVINLNDMAETFSNFKDSLFYDTVGKHSTTSLVFDEDGVAQRGRQDVLSQVFHDESVKIDSELYGLLSGSKITESDSYNSNTVAEINETASIAIALENALEYANYIRQIEPIQIEVTRGEEKTVSENKEEKGQSIGNWITNAAKDVGDWTVNAANDVGKWASNAWSDTKQFATNMAEGIGDFVGQSKAFTQRSWK